MGTHFLNEELNAPNVLEVSFAPSVLEPLTPELRREDFFRISPPWKSDIEWRSANSFRSYGVFLDCFERLGLSRILSPFVEYERRIVLYGGFFVTRSKCDGHDFHVDWVEETENNAFTFLAPLIHPHGAPGLVYRDVRGEIRSYDYTPGRGILLGSRFRHSTDQGTSDTPSVLLSLTFGTDKMQHWDGISKTALRQGNLIRLPNGLFYNKSFD